MKEKYGKLNEKFREKIKHLILSMMKKTTESNVYLRFQRNTRNMKIKISIENLMKRRQYETAEETPIQCKVEKEFQQITNRQGNKKERITEIIIRKAIRRMKNKKAADRLVWKAEWIKEGGEEMVKSLCILFNRIKVENQIPIQW